MQEKTADFQNDKLEFIKNPVFTAMNNYLLQNINYICQRKKNCGMRLKLKNGEKTSVGEQEEPTTSYQEVTVTGQCNETGWYRIEFDGETAYVNDKYLSEIKAEVHE